MSNKKGIKESIEKIILTLGLLGLIINSAQAQHANFDFAVTPIAENVYSIVSPSFGLPTPENKGWNSNSHFVVTEKGVLLFDTGSSELIGNQIKSAIKSVTNQPVRWVINSHSHADHWLGNAAFTDTAIEIIASDQALISMKKYGQEDVKFYSRVTKGTIGATQLVYPTSLLCHQQKRNFGGVDVEFIFSNDGHSPGDVLMWLPEKKIIFGGDVLSSDWMPVITDRGNVQNLISTLYAVAKLNPSIVLTGHGKATTAKSLIRDAELLSSVWEQVKADYENDKKPEETLLEVRAKLEPAYSLLYKDFASEIERHIELMYKLQR
ncbi:MAG: MBL fold metallo-hydrolase [Cyclobacteriaceae bacterium]